MFKRLFALTLTFGVAGTAPPALAMTCATRDTLIESLQSRFSEELTFGGLQEARGGTAMMEIWASDETGTFTVLLSHANGISCVVAAGTDFFHNATAPEPEDTAS